MSLENGPSYSEEYNPDLQLMLDLQFLHEYEPPSSSSSLTTCANSQNKRKITQQDDTRMKLPKSIYEQAKPLNVLTTEDELSLPEMMSTLNSDIQEAYQDLDKLRVAGKLLRSSEKVSEDTKVEEKEELERYAHRLSATIYRRKKKLEEIQTKNQNTLLKVEINKLKLEKAALIEKNRQLEEMLANSTKSDQQKLNGFLNQTATLSYQYESVFSQNRPDSIQKQNSTQTSNSLLCDETNRNRPSKFF